METLTRNNKTYIRSKEVLSFARFINDVLSVEPSYDYFYLIGGKKLRFIHTKWLRNFSLVRIGYLYFNVLYSAKRR